ncbi:MAG: hypothetical protein ACSW8G_05670 [Bacillota bacterium]
MIDAIMNNEELREYFSVECDVDFASDEELQDNLEWLTEGSECNYDLEPFACDGSGGVYVLLDGQKVGYLDSEGQAGIIADCMEDFFSIIANCGYVGDYAKFECLTDEDAFLSYYEECGIPRDKEVVRQFIKDYCLESDPKEIYKIFRSAVMTEPPLILKSTDDDYEDSEQMFEL